MREPELSGMGGAVPGRLGIKEGPVGIGGWLLLPLLHVIIASGFFAIVIAGAFLSHDAVMAGRIRFGLAAFAGALLCYTVICMLRFLYTKKNVPGLMIGYYCLSAVFFLLQINLAGVVASVIWIIYFTRSKRVENTFVN